METEKNCEVEGGQNREIEKGGKEIIVISVGGSLIVPDFIDSDFLREFRKVILKQNNRFIIISGGGKTARKYQEAAKKVIELTREDLDWLGIHGTRLNAHLIRTVFKEEAHPKIIKNPNEKVEFNKKILVASGWKPGFSTDYDAVLLAKNFGIKKLINLTNVDYVYDKDPNKFEEAKPIKEISWKDFRELLPKEWNPGLNTPFDPVAAKEGEKLGLEVVTLNGKNMKNFEDYLNGKEFIGTKIN
ncbi:MAG: UMP kinase [Candidatus Aenigmarchaeota archaeon]|nr:UMP kinase [Candidatus Aenigmarchaeota archaeon]